MMYDRAHIRSIENMIALGHGLRWAAGQFVADDSTLKGYDSAHNDSSCALGIDGDLLSAYGF